MAERRLPCVEKNEVPVGEVPRREEAEPTLEDEEEREEREPSEGREVTPCRTARKTMRVLRVSESTDKSVRQE